MLRRRDSGGAPPEIRKWAAGAIGAISLLAAILAIGPSLAPGSATKRPFDLEATSVVAAGRGGVLVAGDYHRKDFAVLRIRRDGHLDRGFDGDGVKRVRPVPVGHGSIAAMAAYPLPDGDTLVGGYVPGEQPYSVAFVRLNRDGSRDLDFGSNGLALLPGPLTGFTDVAYAAGRLVMVGTDLEDRLVMEMLDTRGQPVPSFGDRGRAVVDIGRDVFAVNARLQTDGKLLIAGRLESDVANGLRSGGLLARIDQLGKLDPTFGLNGLVTTDPLPRFLASPTIDSRGRIIVASTPCETTSQTECLVRFTADGQLDPTFGGDGRLLLNPRLSDVQVTGLALTPEDGLVGVSYGPSGKLVLFKVGSRGRLDRTFGRGGIERLPKFHGPVIGLQTAIVKRDGRILLVTYRHNDAAPFALVRFLEDGTLDRSFGDHGIAVR